MKRRHYIINCPKLLRIHYTILQTVVFISMETIFFTILGELITRSLFLIDRYLKSNEPSTEDRIKRLEWMLLRVRLTVKEAERRCIMNQAMLLLNYDPNSLKVAKLVSEAEACYREAWAGATLGMAGGVGAEPPRYELGFCYIILL
jgi:hypothetical protein